MPVISNISRAEVSAEIQEGLSTVREGLGLTKPQLLAAVAAADQWASDNAAAFNAALPLPARTVLTASQKARLLTAVIEKRWKVGA